jgi:hypothetical protein
MTGTCVPYNLGASATPYKVKLWTYFELVLKHNFEAFISKKNRGLNKFSKFTFHTERLMQRHECNNHTFINFINVLQTVLSLFELSTTKRSWKILENPSSHLFCLVFFLFITQNINFGGVVATIKVT